MPFTPVANRAVVTANGEYSFLGLNVGDDVFIEWDITAGTATVEPGYVSLTGLFKPARDLAGEKPVFINSEGGSVVMDLPASGIAALKVSSAAGGFSMVVSQSKLHF